MMTVSTTTTPATTTPATGPRARPKSWAAMILEMARPRSLSEKSAATADIDATSIAPADAPEEMEDRENVYDGVIKAVVYIGSITQFIVDIEGKHLAQVLYQNLFHTEREEWQQGQKVKVAFWDDSCSLITDVERGMAEKDLMGEVVKRM